MDWGSHVWLNPKNFKMLKIPGYEITELVHESTRTLVYRGRRADGLSVVLKTQSHKYPDVNELKKFYNEFELTKALDMEGVVAVYDYLSIENRKVIVIEDINGESFASLLNRQKPELSLVLELALKITTVLKNIHEAGVIHKDLNPSNIIWNTANNDVRIIDFGLAINIPREAPEILDSGAFEGTPAYISPEQTGRMNRSLDFRSDLYSLGATFFEFVGRRPPFVGDDVLEMIHSHIAKPAPDVREFRPNCPEILANMIMKLLAKPAEERYQSAAGLEVDLNRCRENLRETGSPGLFELGLNDNLGVLQISEKFYGREKEMELMLDAFQRAGSGPCEILLVSGYSGIGKSSLVNESHKQIIELRGEFIAGKFDQFKQNIPYSALLQSLQVLLGRILGRGPAECRKWGLKIEAALRGNVGVLTEVLPELELITGKSELPSKLEPNEAQNRFNLVFQNFIRVFAGSEHPLVVFLDDLQWADRPTLDLMQFLVTNPETSGLLVIGAYRDNEVGESHRLTLTLREIEKRKGKLSRIHLNNLAPEALNQLVADSLKCKRDDALELSRLSLEKTLGNPFFVIQFLKNLYRRDFIRFEQEGARWTWDIGALREAAITENVIDLLTGRLNEFTEQERRTLITAACMGDRFTLKELSRMTGFSRSKTLDLLREPIREGLILSTGFEPVTYKFLHDRVQQAAYDLSDDEERSKTHIDIGRSMLENVSREKLDEKLFDIMGHFNKSLTFLSDPEERIELARLNLRAGKNALNSTAYEPAIEFFKNGIELMGEADFPGRHELDFALFRELSQCEYLSGNFEDSERLMFLLLREKAEHVLEKADIVNLIMMQFISLTRQLEAVDICGEFLPSLAGIYLPNSENLAAKTQVEEDNLRATLKGRQIGELLDVPDISDPNLLQALHLLLNCWLSYYQSGQQAHAVYIILKCMNICLEHGNAPNSPMIYVAFGSIAASVWGEVDIGYEFGRLGLDLVQRNNIIGIKSQVHMLYAGILQYWREPLRNLFPNLLEGFRAGVDGGDLLYAGFAAIFLFRYRFMSGDALAEIYEDGAAYVSFFKRYSDEMTLGLFKSIVFVPLSLMGGTDTDFELSFEDFDEAAHVATLQKPEVTLWLAWYMNSKIPLLFFAERFSEGLVLVFRGRAINMPNVIFGHFQQVDYFFYCSLICIAVLSESGPVELEGEELDRVELLNIIAEYQTILKDWMEQGYRDDIEHKYLLVEAERARLGENKDTAPELYAEAAARAREHQYTHLAALSNYLGGKFYYKEGLDTLARIHISEAHYLYGLWGAAAITNKLEKHYPWLRDVVLEDLDGAEPPEFLDPGTVIRMAQTISGEIELERFQERLLTTVLEQVPADTAVLAIQRGQELSIESVMTMVAGESNMKSFSPRPLDKSRAQEQLVLEAAETEEAILHQQPNSILAVPLLNQAKLSGVIYLEHSAPEVFTSQHLDLLNLLSPQMAIAVENALLYESRKELDELVELERLKTEFYTNTSHELRTPLTLIIAPLRQLLAREEQDLTPEVRELLNLAQRNARALLKLIDDLLEISRFEAGHVSVRTEPTRLGEFCREIVNLFRPMALEGNIKLELSIPDPDPVVQVDRHLMERVLLNLLSNAFKFTKSGGIYLEVDESPAGAGSMKRLLVRDTGEGIAPEYLDSIFERFRGKQSSENYTGTGLGLALVKEMVDLQGGRAQVESRPGAGATFIITLPGAKAADIAPLKTQVSLEDLVRTDIQPESELEPAKNLKAPEFSILIAEDAADMRDYLVSIFQSEFQVFQAEDGRMALNLARETQPDVILSDIMMPEMNGYEFLTALRADSLLVGTPFVFLTGKDDEGERLKGLGFRADEYIQKPFDARELRLRIQKLAILKNQKELTIAREKKSIYAGFNEILAARLNDIQLLSQKLEVGNDLQEDILVGMSKNIYLTVDGFRSCLSRGEDLNLLSSSFMDGMNMIFLRRYASLGRELQFKVSDPLYSLMDRQVENLRDVFFHVCNSIAGKDLEYGQGAGDWNFFLEEPEQDLLRLSFSSRLNFQPDLNIRFLEEEDVRLKLAEINGELEESHQGERYRLEIFLPLRKGGAATNG